MRIRIRMCREFRFSLTAWGRDMGWRAVAMMNWGCAGMWCLVRLMMVILRGWSLVLGKYWEIIVIFWVYQTLLCGRGGLCALLIVFLGQVICLYVYRLHF